MPTSVVSSFTFTPISPTNGQTIQFTDTSTNTAGNGTIVYAWDFGDGTPISTEQNPTHAYYPGAGGGNYTVVHQSRGSVNYAPSDSYATITIQAQAPPATVCNPAGGNVTGIISMSAPDSDKWVINSTYPYYSGCKEPYACTCSPYYAKYQCIPTGAEKLISEYHPDCCLFCGVTVASGTPVTVLDIPNFEVTNISVTPSATCYSGEYIQVVVTVANTGNAAGAATVTLYWDNGNVFDLARVTPVISVNGTQDTPAFGGYADYTGYLCAEVTI